MIRTFESGPARRERTPLALGIVGPSGSGKTKSALRLADGMARVGGGETWVVDTNNRRSLHHADAHRFVALHMPPPYAPSDYGAAFEHAIKSGARRIIVDSISDEWEGEGGVLDMHEEELTRRAGQNYADRDKHNMAAWIRAKREHNKLKLWMFQQPVDWILTFRAKEKIKPVKGKGPEDQGWQPLGADDLIYELLLKCLLRPQADGTPVWTSDIIHERALIKLPGWFRDLFTGGPQLSETIGEQLARWAAGGDVTAAATAAKPLTLIDRFEACSSLAEWVALDAEAESLWRKATPEQQSKPSNVARREELVAARTRARSRVEMATTTPTNAPSPAEQAEILAREARERG